METTECNAGGTGVSVHGNVAKDLQRVPKMSTKIETTFINTAKLTGATGVTEKILAVASHKCG